MPYRTRGRAVVHPLSGKPLQPFCNLDFRDSKELKVQLTTYLRGKYPWAKSILVDTAARKILIDGVERAGYELVGPAPVKAPAAVMH